MESKFILFVILSTIIFTLDFPLVKSSAIANILPQFRNCDACDGLYGSRNDSPQKSECKQMNIEKNYGNFFPNSFIYQLAQTVSYWKNCNLNNVFIEVLVMVKDKNWPIEHLKNLIKSYSPNELYSIKYILNEVSYDFWKPFFELDRFDITFRLYRSMYTIILKRDEYLADIKVYQLWYESHTLDYRNKFGIDYIDNFGCSFTQLKNLSDLFKKRAISDSNQKNKYFEALCPYAKEQWVDFILNHFLNFQEGIEEELLLNIIKYGYDSIKLSVSKRNAEQYWSVEKIIEYVKNGSGANVDVNLIKARFKITLKFMESNLPYGVFDNVIKDNDKQMRLNEIGMLDVLDSIDFYGFGLSNKIQQTSNAIEDNYNNTSKINSYKLLIFKLFIVYNLGYDRMENNRLIETILYNASEKNWDTKDLNKFLETTLEWFKKNDYQVFFDVVPFKDINEVLKIIDQFTKDLSHPKVYYDCKKNNSDVQVNSSGKYKCRK